MLSPIFVRGSQNGNLAALGLLLNGNNTPREGRGMAPRNDLLNGYNGFAQKQGASLSSANLRTSLLYQQSDETCMGGVIIVFWS